MYRYLVTLLLFHVNRITLKVNGQLFIYFEKDMIDKKDMIGK